MPTLTQPHAPRKQLPSSPLRPGPGGSMMLHPTRFHFIPCHNLGGVLRSMLECESVAGRGCGRTPARHSQHWPPLVTYTRLPCLGGSRGEGTLSARHFTSSAVSVKAIGL
jgi:hypothetical protein